jgi:FkbM family methyltransferase
MTTTRSDFPGVGLLPPVLDSSSSINAMADVGSMYLHRDDSVITPTILKTGCWEPDEAAFLKAALRPGHRFLDVGANVGYFSLMASSIIGPSGYVLAVEPEPRNLDLLRANVWRNRAWNVRVLPIAAQAETGYAGLRVSSVNRGDHQIVDATRHSGSLVPAACLDEILGDLTIDVVKVDVQGVDHEVVEGLRGVIAASPGIVLLCEFWLTGLEERGIDPHSVIAGYQESALEIGLLGHGGSATPATSDQVVAACRANTTGFVNLVLNPVRHAAKERSSFAADSSEASGQSRGIEPEVAKQVEALAEEANRAGGAYHVLRPLPGVVVAGEYDMTPLLPAFHLPDDLANKTVLDVGTASGFFAMECARRGASVTAVDVVLWDSHHWAIAELMQWDVRRVQRDIYDLEPSFGQFDLVICGSLLLHLPDPLGAIKRLRGVCRARTIVSTSSPQHDVDGPVCEFIGEQREGGAYWSYWNIGAEALRRMLLAAGFDRVEHQDHFTLTPVPSHPHKWSVLHTVAHGVVAG